MMTNDVRPFVIWKHTPYHNYYEACNFPFIAVRSFCLLRTVYEDCTPTNGNFTQGDNIEIHV